MQFDGLCNLALNRTARQSSAHSKFSLDDASRALSDDGKQDFAFHTDIEDNPWWQVDLEAVYPLYYIVIGNRRKVCQERAITLTAETSLDGQTWQIIHTGLISWDGDLVWPLGGLVSARFMRLSLREKTYFHLAKVEIWGAEKDGLKAELGGNNLLWAETKPEGLHELNVVLAVPSSPTEMILDLGDFYPIWALELATPSKTGFESIKGLKIETSIDGRDWRTVHEGLLFWTGCLYYPLQGEIMARFIKISQKVSGLRHIFRLLRHRLSPRRDWLQVKVFTRRQSELQVRALRHDGMGSRLVALLNAMYMAKLLGCEYKFVWQEATYAAEAPNSIVCLNDAYEIFGADFIQAHLLVNERPNQASQLHTVSGLCRRHLTRADKQDKPGIIHSTYRDPSGFYHPRLEPPDSAFKTFFESLPFSPAFQEIVAMAQGAELPPNFAAIHLRSGDIVFSDLRNEALFWQGKAAPLQLTKMVLDKLRCQNRPVVLFGQDADELNYLAGLYKVFLAADYLPPINALTLPQRDLFETVLMSRASRIYACLSSLFARCAALIGGNIERIDLHQTASSQEKTAYLKIDLEQNAANYHPLQNSFSYLYLYHLNHRTAPREELAFYLDQAQSYDPENEAIKILRAAEYFKFHNDKAGEDLLAAWLKLAFDPNQQIIQYETNRFLPPMYADRHLPFHIKNYFHPLEAAAKQGRPNAAAVMSIMYDLLKNKEQALLWRKMAMESSAARSEPYDATQ